MALSLLEINALLELDSPVKRAVHSNYDQAALFLVDLAYDNLFEPTNALELDKINFRCKLCGNRLLRHERELHHKNHKREIDDAT